MIGFNGTYLMEATHHGMRITAATLGGQWVIDNRYMTPATQQAILAAFGEEGMVVISKTNDYLNAIAATDHARAQQLADFIQEDPLLVCSLVETSKTRWLVGDGESPMISTGISLKGVANLGIIFKYEDVTRAGCSLGSRVGASGSNGLIIQLSADSKDNVRLYMVPGGVTAWPVIHSNLKANQVNEVEVDFANNLIISNGAKASRAFNESAKESATFSCSAKYAAIERVWADKNTLLPFLRNGENGMLDIISCQFYPNANTQGSFTIQLTPKA